MDLEDFAIAWNLMWGLAYIATAFIAPQISGDVLLGTVLYSILGALILVSIILLYTKDAIIGRVLLFILGIIEVVGGVTSWTGVGIWNVPFPNKELFAVSMAFADLISAVFMFYLAIVNVPK